MYLAGDGSMEYPWQVPLDFPESAMHKIALDRFLQFAKNDSWRLKWSCFDKFKYYVVWLLFPFFSASYQKSLRAKHFKNLSDRLHDTFDNEFWDNQSMRSLRITADPTYTSVFIDFIDLRKTQKDYKAPKLPMTLIVGGLGTFSSPYKINFENDILAKSLVLLKKDHLTPVLPCFFDSLNSLLNKLSFYKFNRQTMKDLDDIHEMIQEGNKEIFYPLGTKIQLFVFENKYSQTING
jgi:hypothetical protein